MFDSYSKRLREAAVERRATHLPRLRFIVVAAIGCTVAYIMLAMVIVPKDGPRDYHFIYEHGAITALSALFLTAASAFSLGTMVALTRAKDPHKWVWLVLAVGFAFLSLDELLRFHERVGRLLEATGSSGFFRSWNDIIVILYGIFALFMLGVMLPALMRSPKVFEMFVVAFAFYAIHTFIDSTNEPPTVVSVILEESAKLFCGVFLAIGTFTGLIGAIWKHITVNATPNDT